jgi:hypothetical protein
MLTSDWEVEQSTSGVIDKPIRVNRLSRSRCSLHLELELINQFTFAVPVEKTGSTLTDIRTAWSAGR